MQVRLTFTKKNIYSTKRIVNIMLIGIEERGSLLSTISLFLWGTVGPPLASSSIPSLLEAHHGRPWLTILPPPFYRPPMYSGGPEQDTETNCNEVKEKDKNAPRGRWVAAAMMRRGFSERPQLLFSRVSGKFESRRR